METAKVLLGPPSRSSLRSLILHVASEWDTAGKGQGFMACGPCVGSVMDGRKQSHSETMCPPSTQSSFSRPDLTLTHQILQDEPVLEHLNTSGNQGGLYKPM